jgi:hypothetical protein
VANSTAQTIPLVEIYDYLLASGDPASATTAKGQSGRQVKVTLQYDRALTIAPDVVVWAQQAAVYSALTDLNGFWHVFLVPNNKISPANTYYTVEVEGGPSYQIQVTDVAVPAPGWQSSAPGILLNIPAALAPTTSTVGAITATGLITAQAGINVTAGGVTIVGGLTASGGGTISGGLTVSGALNVSPGETGLDTSSAGALIIGDNVATSIELGAATTVSAGGFSVSVGGAAITGNSTVTGTLTVSTTLTVSAGGAAITGNSTVTGTLTITALVTAQAGLTVSAGVLTVSAGGASITGNLTSNTQLIALGSPGVTNNAADLTLTGTPSVRLTQAYKVRAFPSGATSLTSGVWGKIALNTVSGAGGYDTNANFNTGTNTWTCPVAGYYLLQAAIQHAATSGRVGARFNKNAGTILQSNLFPAHASGNTSAVAEDIQLLAVNDTIILEGFQESGGAANANAGTTVTHLAIMFLST